MKERSVNSGSIIFGITGRRRLIYPLTVIMLLTMGFSSCGKKDDTAEGTIESAARQAVAYTDEYVAGERNITNSRLYLSHLRELVEELERNVETLDSIKAIPVTVTNLRQEDITREITYLGDIQSSHSVKVYTKFPDKIKAYHVRVGDSVTPQQPLVQISNDMQAEGLKQAEAALRSAESQYENIQAEFKRMERLYNENAVSIAQFDQIKTQKQVAKNGLDQARAGYNTAKKNFDDALVKAPITGIVTERNLEIGDMAPVQLPLVTISKIGSMKIIVNVVEKELPDLKVGGKAIVEVTAFADRLFEGRIVEIAPVVDPRTRTARVEIEINNPEGLLKPGMFARVRLVLQETKNAWVIDKDIVNIQTYQEKNEDNMRDSRILKKYSLYVVNDEMSHLRVITPGIVTRDRIQVLDGVNPEEFIIDLGRNLVRDSSLVNVIKN